jgi:hypothetical protein
LVDYGVLLKMNWLVTVPSVQQSHSDMKGNHALKNHKNHNNKLKTLIIHIFKAARQKNMPRKTKVTILYMGNFEKVSNSL